MDNNLNGYYSAGDIVTSAMHNLNIVKPLKDLTDNDIRGIIRWIGYRTYDTILTEGKPILGRIGIGLMLSVALMEFPDYFAKFSLWQLN